MSVNEIETVNSYPFIHVDTALRNAADAGMFSGASLIAARGDIRHEVQVGRAQSVPDQRELTAGTLFDLASLTKVLATTWLAMRQVSDGRLDIDAPLQDLLPGYYPNDKHGLTVALLLGHASGLPAGLPLRQELRPDEGAPPRQDVVERLLQAPLLRPPGEATVYSDIGPIMVADLLEQLNGSCLHEQCQTKLYDPLGLKDTLFVPFETHGTDGAGRVGRESDDFAATEQCAWRGRMLCGEVHDEKSHLLRGVAGHAGLFSTARDLERIARAILDGSQTGVDAETWTRLTCAQHLAPDSQRAFGWDRPLAGGSAGSGWSARAFGHTGFTGTSLWIDPPRQAFVVLLSNRVHPTREDRGFLELRPRLHDDIWMAFQA